jgi:hypothetical protein
MAPTRHWQNLDHMRVRREHFHHEADIGIRGIGPDLATFLEQAAQAMTAVICEHSHVSPTTEFELISLIVCILGSNTSSRQEVPHATHSPRIRVLRKR